MKVITVLPPMRNLYGGPDFEPNRLRAAGRWTISGFCTELQFFKGLILYEPPPDCQMFWTDRSL